MAENRLTIVQNSDHATVGLSDREILTCMYWMISLAHRGRAPPHIRTSPMLAMQAIKQLAKIQSTEREANTKLYQVSRMLLGRVIQEDDDCDSTL
jgi:hypothetical protein